jgi:hypothetical protein
MKNMPKIYWWVRYEIGGQYGLLPKPYSTQEEASTNAMGILRGAGKFDIYPLTTNIWRIAAKKLQATIVNNNKVISNAVANSNNPLANRFY